jgi:hypothetical protein
VKKLVIVGITIFVVGCGSTESTSSTTRSHFDPRSRSACHSPQGQLPDLNCTPGEIDTRVKQSNIHTTICKSGYTDTVRPSAKYTNKLKKQQIIQYGYADKNPQDYEEDHLVSLELGGDPKDPRNLWPESPRNPNPKDRVENALHRAVCDGKMKLAEAQQEIAADWISAYKKLFGTNPQ